MSHPTPSIDRLLAPFASHTLADTSKAVLMNRVDTKFILPMSVLPELLGALHPLCTVLDFNGRKISRYESLYYDTPKLHFYHTHHNGKLNRYKVRCRTYADVNASYLEVKFKNNKRRTIKSRVKVPTIGEPSMADQSLKHHHAFLQECGVNDTRLSITQKCDYSRLAFASEATAERLTIDIDLRYGDLAQPTELSFGQFLIVELKQSEFNRSSALYQTLHQCGGRPHNFSKYCMGMHLLQGPQLKANRFKETIMTLHRMNQTAQEAAHYE